jgi:DNA-binding protein YbaB
MAGVTDHRWNPIIERAEGLVREAGAAKAGLGTAAGSDPSGAAGVVLGGDGRVESVTVAADWRKLLPTGALENALGAAIGAAGTARLEAWAQAVADPAAVPAPGLPLEVPTDFARRLQEAATAEVTQESGTAALNEVLSLLQQVEQGLDEVSAKLNETVNRQLTGRSGNGQATVTVSGGGEFQEIRYERRWLRQAHAVDIERQTLAALHDAYAKVDRAGVAQLIAASPLGEAQRAVQDPFGLARRMRLTQ